MPKRKTTAEDAPVKDTKMRDDDESSSDVRFHSHYYTKAMRNSTIKNMN